MPKSGVERTDARAVLAELRGVGGDGEVAEHVQDVAAADGEAVDGGDDRLGHVADDPVQRLDLEQTARRRPVVAGLHALLLITAGAERLVAGPGQAMTPTSLLAQARLNANTSSSTVCARNAL